MTSDLTDNDLVLRQINAAPVIRRLLAERLDGSNSSLELQAGDYYGDARYWQRGNLCTRLVLACFLLLCLTQQLVVKALLLLLSPATRLNVVIQLRRKARQYDKTKVLLQRLLAE